MRIITETGRDQDQAEVAQFVAMFNGRLAEQQACLPVIDAAIEAHGQRVDLVRVRALTVKAIRTWSEILRRVDRGCEASLVARLHNRALDATEARNALWSAFQAAAARSGGAL